MEKILNLYYANNALKLHKMVDKILLKFSGLSDKDMDDFYSLANEVFVDVMRRYDSSKSFDRFLYSCLSNKIKSEMTKRNRKKRKADKMSISIDKFIGNESDCTIGDMIPDKFDLEKEVFEEKEEYNRKIVLYLSKLSKLQKEVLRLSIAGYLPNEIRDELHINEKQYVDCKEAIRSYRNRSVLF